MGEAIAIDYYGQVVEVSKEVAEFLETDNRRLRSQARSDRRHIVLSRLDPWAVVGKGGLQNPDAIADQIIRNIENQQVRMVIRRLSPEEQNYCVSGIISR